MNLRYNIASLRIEHQGILDSDTLNNLRGAIVQIVKKENNM
jgi:hypothetical protein